MSDVRSRSGGRWIWIRLSRRAGPRGTAACHQLRELAVGRGDDAHVHAAREARAEHLVAAVLQHAQQLDLRLRLELAISSRKIVPPSLRSKRPCGRRARP